MDMHGKISPESSLRVSRSAFTITFTPAAGYADMYMCCRNLIICSHICLLGPNKHELWGPLEIDLQEVQQYHLVDTLSTPYNICR